MSGGDGTEVLSVLSKVIDTDADLDAEVADRLTKKSALAARVEAFHGTHNQKSHGGEGGAGVIEGATVEHRGGSISGVVSGEGHASRRGRVRVLWEDGSVSEVDPDELVVTEESSLAVRPVNPLLSMVMISD